VDWYGNVGLTGSPYDFNTPVTGNITLYAKWDETNSLTVTFNSNGGSTVASQTVGKDGMATRPFPDHPGYAFLGWHSNSDLTALYNFGTTVTGNITLYAKWREMTADEKADFGSTATIHDIFTVSNLDEWNTAIVAIKGGGNDKNYAIDVTADFTVPGTTATFGTATGIKVSLRGSGTLTLSGTGYLIYTRPNQMVILRDLTLKGYGSNDKSVVSVTGTFTMQSGVITGNTSSANFGGGVYVSQSGTFTMNGGTISGNTAGIGGGVFVGGTNSVFTMNGGTISGNTATTTSTGGGGVYIYSGGTFTMYGGTISGNKATNGGGVFVNSTANFFRIVTGTIYGSNASTVSLRNTATSGAALYNATGTAQRGTFNGTGGAWVSSGNLTTTNNTINVVNGAIVP
jgi:uncharacterized repeat protein (TIGR02543 family)